ncbi:mycofactocin-coupled SDR family oxidoreductase [Amycolatopsis acidicola]|uniref:Mycofactocin-coupled SDR family oxidoreductase n=1 Tax=Amycolatopsis acidicola TaxID=2596893 RepID=A0A5N0V7I6_9PSEU|nr:mycofactocin-coupled SDR family oxidoreductase [Amycolatopsis acidicola]KAA9160472.1 mycofactocin-coupled SDR family oxidoreductase [Amycolatopsis acidicola]
MGSLEGKVAFVTGAGRGQGRSHAVELARAGADVIAIDLGADIDTIPYPLASKDDLEETGRLVRELGRRAVVKQADVRDLAAVRDAVGEGRDELGGLDIVVANAGVIGSGKVEQFDEAVYRDIVEVNMFGVWHTIAASAPAIIEGGKGGSIILTSSTQGLTGRGGDGSAASYAYASSKHAVVGLMRSAAHAYAKHGIRVNTVHPTGVATPMVLNDFMMKFFQENPSAADMAQNLLPVQFVEAGDISKAVVWLAGDEAKFVTGVTLPVDAGFVVR